MKINTLRSGICPSSVESRQAVTKPHVLTPEEIRMVAGGTVSLSAGVKWMINEVGKAVDRFVASSPDFPPVTDKLAEEYGESPYPPSASNP